MRGKAGRTITTDGPHQESEYLHSRTVNDEHSAGAPADETDGMVAGNVINFLHLGASPAQEYRLFPRISLHKGPT